jgi:hypothetical protein
MVLKNEMTVLFALQGTLVYVNYARVEDFEYLEKNKSINITGKIAFARYGKIFRGDKVRPWYTFCNKDLLVSYKRHQIYAQKVLADIGKNSLKHDTQFIFRGRKIT